ncbi:MAG: SusC/RagA family TonB-linked outer membrane protein [Bacteroidia bacterium]|nr:SusC/RagA family TonB-linked outer membrane protein [Bacteroidia bacterium]
MRKTLTLLALLLAFCSLQVSAQDRTISGKVSSSQDNQTIPGVSVVVVGTTIGTSTDIDGNYKLNVPKTAKTLRYSGIGMRTKEVALGASNVLDVVLDADVMKLDEVVVTALGIKQEKKAVGYSVQDVGGDALTKAGSRDVINGMSAKVSGMTVINSTGTPGGSSFIRLRGWNSILGSNSPLFVVDGVPMDNSYNLSGNPDDGTNNGLESVSNSNRALDINPDDIESVTVLKGPAASALYGGSAANGAIIITTKKGKAPAGKKGVSVTFNSSIQWDQVNKLPELQDKFSQGTSWETGTPSWYGPDYVSQAGLGGYPRQVSWGAMIDTLYWDGSDYKWDKNGRIVGASDPNAKKKVTPYDPYDFFRTGVTYDNSIAISGGNDLASFRASVGHLKQTGIVPLSDWARTSVKFAGEAKVSQKLLTSGTVTYTNSGGRRVQQGSNLSGIMLGLLRTPPTFDNSNGVSDPSNPEAYMFPDGTQRTYRGGAGYDNPYWTINKNPFNDDVNRVFGTLTNVYNVTDWFDITHRIGTDFYSDRRKQAFDINSRQNPAGQIFEDQNFYRHVYSDLMFNFKYKLNDSWNGNFLVGNNFFSRKTQRVYTQGDGLNLPDFYNMSNAQSVLTKEFTYRYRTASVFADWKIDFKDMLFLNATGRFEKSSTLPKDENVYFYPSASIGFVFTEALGMNNNKVLPFGKLRASIATVGNDASEYSLNNVFNGGFAGDGWTNGVTFPFNGVGGFTVADVAGNPNIKPEKTTSKEFGVDLRFLDNRLGVDFTVYQSNSVDQIIPVTIPGSSGFAGAILNSGELENKGIELMLNATPVKSKNFTWDLTLNWSRNRSKVISLYEGVESLYIGGFEGSDARAFVGQPYGVLYGGVWERDGSGNIIIEDDPTSFYYGFPLASADLKVIGDPNPDWIGSISNTFTYKRWSLNVLIERRQGGDIWNGTEGALTFFGMSELTEDRGTTKVFEGVKASDGTPNDISVTLGEDWYTDNGGGFGAVTEQFIEDGSYTRLRQASLTYSVDPKLIKGTPFSSIDLSVIGTNLLLITDYEGVDPETSLTGANNSQGLDYFNNPGTKSYGVRLRVTF